MSDSEKGPEWNDSFILNGLAIIGGLVILICIVWMRKGTHELTGLMEFLKNLTAFESGLLTLFGIVNALRPKGRYSRRLQQGMIGMLVLGGVSGGVYGLITRAQSTRRRRAGER